MRHYLNIVILYSVWAHFDLIPLPDRTTFDPLNDQWIDWWMKWQIFTPILLLQVLNLIWYYLILRILVRALFLNDRRDERSDNEDEVEGDEVKEEWVDGMFEWWTLINWYSHLPIICLIDGRKVDERSRKLDCVWSCAECWKKILIFIRRHNNNSCRRLFAAAMSRLLSFGLRNARNWGRTRHMYAYLCCKPQEIRQTGTMLRL